MHLIEILVPIITLAVLCLLQRNTVDKIKGEPLLAEEALVHAKSEHGNRYQKLYLIHFYVAARDTVVNCKVSSEVWHCLEKGQRGILRHQGGLFSSFERDGELICGEATGPRQPGYFDF